MSSSFIKQEVENLSKFDDTFPTGTVDVQKLPSDNISFLAASDRSAAEQEIRTKYWPHIRAKGYHIVVKPYVRSEKSLGGIILTSSTREEDQHHSTVAQIIDIGPVAFTDAKVSGGLSWADIGDWVVIPRVGGARVTLTKEDGESCVLRIVKEDDIIATVSDPEEWQIRFTSTKF